MLQSSTSSKCTALITGASTGIGAVYADRLAKRGYDLILIARNGKLLNELASSLTASTGRKVEALPADLTRKDELRTIEQRLRADSSITALVNNAGFGGVSTLLDSSVDDMENMIDLNITALLRLTAAVLPGFVERKGGAIINISSIVAVNPELLNGVYSGTKAFVIKLTQSLHKEVGDKGIAGLSWTVGSMGSAWLRGFRTGSNHSPSIEIRFKRPQGVPVYKKTWRTSMQCRAITSRRS